MSVLCNFVTFFPRESPTSKSKPVNFHLSDCLKKKLRTRHEIRDAKKQKYRNVPISSKKSEVSILSFAGFRSFGRNFIRNLPSYFIKEDKVVLSKRCWTSYRFMKLGYYDNFFDSHESLWNLHFAFWSSRWQVKTDRICIYISKSYHFSYENYLHLV